MHGYRVETAGGANQWARVSGVGHNHNYMDAKINNNYIANAKESAWPASLWSLARQSLESGPPVFGHSKSPKKSFNLQS